MGRGREREQERERASERARCIDSRGGARSDRARMRARRGGRAGRLGGARRARRSLAFAARRRGSRSNPRGAAALSPRASLSTHSDARSSLPPAARARARRPPARAHRRGVGVGAAPQVGARELRVPRPLLDQRPGVPDEGRLSGERRSWWVRARCGCDGSMISKSRLERARGRGGNGGQGGGGDATEGPRAGSSEGACACVRVHVCACVPESATARCAQLAGCPRCSCSEQTCAAGSDARGRARAR
jgi:hypothetical protein